MGDGTAPSSRHFCCKHLLVIPARDRRGPPRHPIIAAIANAIMSRTFQSLQAVPPHRYALRQNCRVTPGLHVLASGKFLLPHHGNGPSAVCCRYDTNRSSYRAVSRGCPPANLAHSDQISNSNIFSHNRLRVFDCKKTNNRNQKVPCADNQKRYQLKSLDTVFCGYVSTNGGEA